MKNKEVVDGIILIPISGFIGFVAGILITSLWLQPTIENKCSNCGNIHPNLTEIQCEKQNLKELLDLFNEYPFLKEFI